MINRRKFLLTSSMVTGIGLTTSRSLFANSVEAREKKPALVKPQKLSKGDTIGLITPASAVSRTAFEKTMENLDKLGFRIVYSKNMRITKGFLGGTNKQRIDDIHSMFSNPEINGIVCARGGYGTGRLLPELNYDLIKANPKVLVGYSDITALLYGIYKQTGLVCFHGPVGASTFTPFTLDQFEKVMMKGKNRVVIKPPKEWKEEVDEPTDPPENEYTDSAYNQIRISPGIAKGQLIGGNLSLMVSLIGTPFDIDFTDKIVFIEEVGESLYRIDRMITQLLLSGKLQKASGVVLGVFKGCDLKPDDPGYAQSLSLKEVLMDLFGKLEIPILYGLPFGHINDNATLPFGIEAELDVEKGSLTLLESAVV